MRDDVITISMERFVELVESEIKLKYVRRKVEKEKIYISREDLLIMLDINEDGDE